MGVGDKIFKSAFETAELAKLNLEEMKKYEISLKKFKSIEGVKNAYLKDGENIGIKKGIEIGLERGIVKGMEKGMEKGLKKGMEKGIEKGIEKGRFELKLELAEHFINNGFPVDEVVKLTQLPLDVVLEIRDRLKRE